MDDTTTGQLLRHWLKWVFQVPSITVCVGDSRSSVPLATWNRRYTSHRELAVLAALKVGNDEGYDSDPMLVCGLAVTLWNALIRADGGRVFACSHTADLDEANGTRGCALTNMYPMTATTTREFAGIHDEYSNWRAKEGGELLIPKGSPICYFSERDTTEYRLYDDVILG